MGVAEFLFLLFWSSGILLFAGIVAYAKDTHHQLGREVQKKQLPPPTEEELQEAMQEVDQLVDSWNS